MGEARQRRELSGVGVEAHRSVTTTNEKAWALHRKHGHPAGYEGPCWGPTLVELQEARDYVMQQRMKAVAKKNEDTDEGRGDSAPAAVEASSGGAGKTGKGTTVRSQRKRA